MSKISDIVNVDITIDNPTQDSASFSNMLIIVEKPATLSKVMADVISIDDASKLLDYGYTQDEAAYKAVDIAFKQTPKPELVYITAIQSTDGTNETPDKTLARAINTAGWYGIAVGYEATGDDYLAIAKWTESNEKLFILTYTEGESPISTSTYDRTIALYAGSTDGDVPDDNKYAGIAWMAKTFGYSAGSETWSFKTLAGITPSVLTATMINNYKENNINFYHTVSNKDITQEGKVGSGEWIDIIRFRDWLKNEIQSGVYQYLTSNAKVIFDDDGITGISNIIEEKLKAGQDAQGIDADRFDDDGVIDRAYTVSVPKSASISDTDKAARKLKNVTFSARLAGAIHYTSIKGSLVY